MHGSRPLFWRALQGRDLRAVRVRWRARGLQRWTSVGSGIGSAIDGFKCPTRQSVGFGVLAIPELVDALVELIEEIGAAGLHSRNVVGDRLVVYLVGHPHAVP